MKVGILLINNDPSYRGGVNSFIHGLLWGLGKEDKKNQYYLLVCQRDEKYYRQYLSGNFRIKVFSDENKPTLEFKYFVLSALRAPILRNLYYLAESYFYSKLINEINSLNLDVIYSPSMPFFPLRLRGKLVISPHDIQHVHFPQYFSLVEKWTRATIFKPSLRLARIVQASSNFMKKDFNKKMKVPLKKIVVIPEGVMDDFLKFKPNKEQNNLFLKKYSLTSNYLFYPSQHWPHKNHLTLLKAVLYLKQKYLIDVKVVFTGEKQQKFNFLYGFVEENGLESTVTFLGNIKFSELLYAYYNALVVVIPVVYESSSLPIKEAMALGKPVVASRNGANEEINVNNNILLFSTYNYKELAEKIKLLVGNKTVQKRLVDRSNKVIKGYSWRMIAKKYVEVFDKVSSEY